MRSICRPLVLAALTLPCLQSNGADRPAELAVWLSPGGPWGIWEKSVGDPFPVKRIAADLSRLGVTDILFFEQCGRGGPFLHPTTVQHAKTEPRMKGRDFLAELLSETQPRGVKVWLAWTTPGGKYPGTEFEGLNHPRVIQIYLDEIEEIARRYGRQRGVEGILWHEVDCSEAVDAHADDLPEFVQWCRKEFKEEYPGTQMPRCDSNDRWWRRLALYKIHVVNAFVEKTALAARQHGLKTAFCSYVPEAFAGESWRWGYDIVGLERICDRQWFSGYSVEAGKPYQEVTGAWIDFGPSYRGQVLTRNYLTAFHGKPLSYFEYRSPFYVDEVRRYYSGHKTFHKTHGDIYTGYLGHSAKEVDLLLGPTQFPRWVGQMRQWQGGRSPARVAIAVNPTPFVLRHPEATGSAYQQRVRGLMSKLTEWTDVDGLLLGSRFSEKVENLLRYDLILIPEDMGLALPPAVATSLRTYLERGGQLFLLGGRVTHSRPDLTDAVDQTDDWFGVEVKESGLPGYAAPTSTRLNLPADPFWVSRLPSIRLHGAQPVSIERRSGKPCLLQHGRAWYSSLGLSAESLPYFAALVPQLVRPPIRLVDNTGLKIVEAVQRDGQICLALFGRGQARLSVDAERVGLTGQRFRVDDVVSGRAFGVFGASALREGVLVQIEHPLQPRLLVLQTETAPAPSSLYASDTVFAGIPPRAAAENPEVPEEGLVSASEPSSTTADRPIRGDKQIGVVDYARRYTVRSPKAVQAAFQAAVAAVKLAGLTPETVDVDLFLPAGRKLRDRYRRIFIPASTDYFSRAMYEGMIDYVRRGGLLITNSSLILLDANADYRIDSSDTTTRFAAESLLGVHGHASSRIDAIRVELACPLTTGLKEGEWIKLKEPLGGRRTRNLSAEPVLRSTCQAADGTRSEQPFLTFKHQDRGACIYIVGSGGQIAEGGPMAQVLRNLLADSTLQWLCRQD